MYRDRSIGNSINIVVVKIVFLETHEVWFRVFSETFRVKVMKNSSPALRELADRLKNY